MESQKVGLILNSASYDKVANALSMANIYAAHLKEVHIFFTYGAILRLLENKAEEVGDETEAWLRQPIREGLEKGTIPRVSEMLSFSKGFGVKIYACTAAVAFHKLSKDQLNFVDEVTSISSFLEKIEGTATLLYI
jgi:peroxiredoxin family protein